MLTPRPTPGDLFAGRPRTVLTARPQGVPAPPSGPTGPALTALSDGEPFVPRYRQAVQAAGLHRHSTAIALALAGRADWHTGRIPDDAQLGFRALAKLTGIGESAAHNHVCRLQRAGWIRRTPPPVVGAPSRIELLIPPAPGTAH